MSHRHAEVRPGHGRAGGGDLVFDHYRLATGAVDAALTPHGVRVALVLVCASANGIPSIVTGAAGHAILVHMYQLSAALGTRLTITGDRGFVRSSGGWPAASRP